MTGLPIEEGELVLGKYRVERVLGQGAMGVVVEARHVDLGELFAIKLMLPQALSAPTALERFLQEARASARLKSIHVARVYDVGRIEGGAPYMIMEHLVGTDLSKLLKTRGPLPVEDVITYMKQACEAVVEAHAIGIVHRDLKPANMFLIRLPNGSPCVKVLDFGVSKQLIKDDAPGHELTQAGSVLGSPLYMPPEQMTGKGADPRSDVWALGVVTFELLTGTYPFQAMALAELIAKVLQEEPPRPSEVRPGIPPALDKIVLTCLEKKPERRFQTVADLLSALSSLRPSSEPPSVGLSMAEAPAPSIKADQPPSTGASLIASQPPPPAEANARTTNVATVDRPPPKESSGSRLTVTALLVVIAAGGTAWFMSRTPQKAPASPEVSAAAAPAPPSATAKSAKSKKWWDDLPSGKTAQPSAKLPPPRLAWLDLRNKAALLEQDQKPEEARAALLKALDLAKKQLGPEDAAYPETLQQLARLYAKMGKLDEAEKLLREALEVMNQYGDPAEEGFDDTRQALIAVLVKQGKTDEAAKLRKETDPPLAPASAAPSAPASASAAPPKAGPPKPRNPFEAWDSYK